MGGGNAIEQARETIDGMDDQQLAAASSAYRDLIAQGFRRRGPRAVRADAEECGFRPHRAGVGHRRRGYRQDLVSRRTRAGRPRRLAQTAGKAALAGTEALQEVGEGVATQKGINAGASMDLDPLAGSFGNAALGFVAGMGPGAVHGAAEGVRHRSMATAPTMEAGDVVHASGKPFITARAPAAESWAAMRRCCASRTDSSCGLARARLRELVPHPRRRATRRRLRARQPEPGPGGASESAGFQPDQQVYVRQGGREIAVEFVGLERNAATARAGGEPLARIHARRPRAFRPPVGVVRRPAARQRLAPGGRRAAGARTRRRSRYWIAR